MSDPIAVETACPCPGTPHDSDTVYLRRTLPLAAGVSLQSYLAALSTQMPTMERAELNGKLAEVLLLYGVEGWTYTTERGPLEVTDQSIRDVLLSNFGLATKVADEAADYYAELIVSPLAQRALSTSRRSRTGGSTRQSGSSGSKTNGRSPRPKQSRPSSTSTTPTDDTEPISSSPGGVSRS